MTTEPATVELLDRFTSLSFLTRVFFGQRPLRGMMFFDTTNKSCRRWKIFLTFLRFQTKVWQLHPQWMWIFWALEKPHHTLLFPHLWKIPVHRKIFDQIINGILKIVLTHKKDQRNNQTKPWIKEKPYRSLNLSPGSRTVLVCIVFYDQDQRHKFSSMNHSLTLLALQPVNDN